MKPDFETTQRFLMDKHFYELAIRTNLIDLMSEFGKQCYNQALEDAAENTDFGICQNDNGCPCMHDSHFIDKDSILKLKL